MKANLSQGADDDIYYKNIDISFHIIITVGSGNLAHRRNILHCHHKGQRGILDQANGHIAE